MASTAHRLVLVVEDDDSMREAIARLLQAAAFDTMAYASAEALLAAGPGSGAACVVSDFKLPAMSGLDLLERLRERGLDLPVVLITTPTTAIDARVEALGVELVPKPLVTDELSKRLWQMADGRA